MAEEALRLSSIFADVFKPVWVAAKHHKYTHFWLKGGRGSTKSSFISLSILLLLSMYTNVEALIFRKVADTLKSSVYEQMLWAIDMFGMNSKIHKTTHPLQITLNTGQRIMFRGLDEPGKIKSIKSAQRYFGIGWYEELDEFGGMEEIRKVNQSIIRGDFPFWMFYSYNPPVNKSNWVNQEADIARPDRLTHHSTYLDVPQKWLGQPFIQEAEITKETKPRVYRHEYLGEITGTGGIIFPNVKAEAMSNAQVREFDNIRQGIDWGYTTDPFVYTKLHYDKKHRSIYIYDEIYKHNLSNRNASALIKEKEYSARAIIADSSEPKSIDEMKGYGHVIKGAEKGQGSIEYGIKFLQSLDAIYIDKNRCPNTYREFSNYELEKNKNGEFKQDPPDKNNHCLVGNTSIITDKGNKYIRNIKVGDKVLTTAGYKEVEWSGISDTNRQVYKVITDNGKYIVGTNNHKVFTLRGFVRIDKLKTGDIVLTKEGTQCQNVLNYTEENGEGIQSHKDLMTETISKVDLNICTTSYGKNLSEQGKKDMLSIIKMEILQIMNLQTWKKFYQKLMDKGILQQKKQNEKENGLTLSDLSQKNGIEAKKVENGIVNMEKNVWKKENQKQKSAYNAEKNMKQSNQEENSVLITVKVNGEENKELTTLLNNVNIAEKSSLQTSIQEQGFALASVQTIKRIGKAKKVYDLTVKDKHEFFANGILVHNCIDSVRYSLEGDMKRYAW